MFLLGHHTLHWCTLQGSIKSPVEGKSKVFLGYLQNAIILLTDNRKTLFEPIEIYAHNVDFHEFSDTRET